MNGLWMRAAHRLARVVVVASRQQRVVLVQPLMAAAQLALQLKAAAPAQ